jgi:putative addiction module component (TIGR02574 family)
MDIKNLAKYNNAEKIILVEQLWDTISKNEIEISEDVKTELDIRLQNLQNKQTPLYTWDEVKNYLTTIRK